MSKRFAELPSQPIPGLRDACRRTELLTGQTFLFWDRVGHRYIYNLVTKIKFFEKPNLPTSCLTLEEMKSHARLYIIPNIAIPKIECGFDRMKWQEVVKLLEIFLPIQASKQYFVPWKKMEYTLCPQNESPTSVRETKLKGTVKSST